MKHTHPKESLQEAIIGVISAMDKPGSPAGEAIQDFYNKLFGRKLEDRIIFRERVLGLTLKNLQHVAEKYLYRAAHSTAIIGGSESLKQLPGDQFEIESLR